MQWPTQQGRQTQVISVSSRLARYTYTVRPCLKRKGQEGNREEQGGRNTQTQKPGMVIQTYKPSLSGS